MSDHAKLEATIEEYRKSVRELKLHIARRAQADDRLKPWIEGLAEAGWPIDEFKNDMKNWLNSRNDT
jgi:hypothetical protein